MSGECPHHGLLIGYALGTIPEEQAEAVAEHVETCAACEATVEGLESEGDTVVNCLRRPTPPPAETDSPECREAIARAEAIVGVRRDRQDRAPARGLGASAVAEGERLGEYELLDKLGEGGMGAVYKARHTKLKRIVALKILPREKTSDLQAIARFEREMEAVGQLDHANIVRAYDAREIDGIHFLVMEYVAGLDFATVGSRLGPWPIPEACEAVRQAALGLQYAHEHGLVHRDIKPSNLMLTQGSRQTPSVVPAATGSQVKILDLGLALLNTLEPGTEELTSAGQAMGTADYMAPEQTTDSHAVDIRADVYSLGCTLYKLLTGQAPFTGPKYRTAMQKMVGHLQDQAPPIRTLRSDVPDELAALVHQMLAKSPESRPATPAAVAVALEPFARQADLRRLHDEAAAARGNSVRRAAETSTQPRGSSESAGVGRRVPTTVNATVTTAAARIAARPKASARRYVPWVAGGLAVALLGGGIFWGTMVLLRGRDGKVVGSVHIPEAVTVEIIQDGVQPTVPLQRAGEGPAGRRTADNKPSAPAIAPFDAAARKHQQACARQLGVPIEMTNSIGMKLVLIPPGEFEMGSSEAEMTKLIEEAGAAKREEWYIRGLRGELPKHRVRITKPFWLAACEVTRSQFQRFVENRHYRTEAERSGKGGWGALNGRWVQDRRFVWNMDLGVVRADDYPVVNVSWNDATAFCEWLSEKEGKAYHLPTEAQWEYACRAETATRWSFGDDESSLGEYAWHAGNANGMVHPVGGKRPNSWGLHDMHGNVWETCQDWFDEEYYRVSVTDDPKGPASGTVRVCRGGGWSLNLGNCRAACRDYHECDAVHSHVGFRVARVASGEK